MAQHNMSQSAQQNLAAAIEAAGRASAYALHARSGESEPRITPKPAVEATCINLREMHVLASAVSTAHATIYAEVPVVEHRPKSMSVDAAVIAASLVAGAGASVIIAAERNAAQNGVVPVFYRDAGLFRVVEPAPFRLIADGGSADRQPAPWSQARISWDAAPSVAFRTTFSRREQKDVGGAELVENVLGAIVRGLAVEADRTVLNAIELAGRPTFTLAQAAARGLRFADLAGFAGTRGNGAYVDATGSLRVAGVKAELTPSCEATIVGAFDRTAVAIHPEVVVHIERLNAYGDLNITVFADIQAIVPDPSAFWTVGAE